jgi:hypothetical protein
MSTEDVFEFPAQTETGVKEQVINFNFNFTNKADKSVEATEECV